MDNAQTEIVVYGTAWCWDCRRTRRFLDKNKIPYRFIDIDQDANGRAYVEKVNSGMRSVPTIVLPNGDLLVEPADSELASCFDIPVSSN
ncbi:MAG: glutaredoxin family protein [Chloroflexi bacterium]|nr:glutaredoxin family protein [Chloroflexota bacterium]